jgi:hypothetical protein
MSTFYGETTWYLHDEVKESVLHENLKTLVSVAEQGKAVNVEACEKYSAELVYNLTVTLLEEMKIRHSAGPHLQIRVAQDNRPGSPMQGSIRFYNSDDKILYLEGLKYPTGLGVD